MSTDREEIIKRNLEMQKDILAKRSGASSPEMLDRVLQDKEPDHFLPSGIRAKTRVGGRSGKRRRPRKPKPAFPKVSVSGGRRSSRSKPPPGFKPPRLPGARR